MTSPSKPHYEAWLGAHPHRSRRWLRAKAKEGFDIHHLDGDHENNDPKNLVLIEHTDHMSLHNGGTHFLGRLTTQGKLYRRAQKAYYDGLHERLREWKALPIPDEPASADPPPRGSRGWELISYAAH